MKGTMTITVDGNAVHCEGNIFFTDEAGPYFVAACFARALGISTPEKIAHLTLVAALFNGKNEKSEITKIMMPDKRKEKETDGRND